MNKLDEALGLFPSVIKCGEKWSATCQSVLDGAKAELAVLRSTAPQALAATPAVGGEELEPPSALDLALDRESALADQHPEQPEYLTGCLHPGSCQSRGMCQSQSCNHAGKVIVKRVCVEPKEAGIVYPKVET